MNYKEEAKRQREKAEACKNRARESFERCGTDGFVSQWASDLSGDLASTRAKIAENRGRWEFPALFDLRMNRVPAKLIDGKFGPCWAICEEDGRFSGIFISAFPARESTMKNKGYIEGTEEAPAAAKIAGNGKGLVGASSCYVKIFRTDRGY